MKPINYIFCLFFLVLILACNKKEEKQIVELPEGSINLSEVATQHDYYLPFAILNDNPAVALIFMNGDTLDLTLGKFVKFDETGFFELILQYKNPNRGNDTILFTTKSEEREFSEWGISTWIPGAFETTLLGSEEIEIYYPHRYTDSVKVPFIFYVKESGMIKAVYAQGNCPVSGDTFNIKQGVGSVNVKSSALSNQVEFMIGGKQINVSLSEIAAPAIILQNPVTTHIEIPANSLVRISDNLEIASSGSITINEGTTVLIDEAVDINVSGPVIFSGTANNPVFVTCSSENNYWGGFITRSSGGTIEAGYTIFCQSGYHASGNYNWGHAQRQALFYTENSTLTLNHCFMLDHIGQIFYPQYSTLTLDNILVQRAKTGGQVNFSELIIRNSVFTDFPNDSYIFNDNDNDALYLSASDAIIDNTKFMFAKDDGLDSGNDDGGEITLTNCRFEACFHEGAALSSRNTVIKNHTFIGCVFANCGQGLELGFSSPNHTVVAENCTFIKNGVGVRYGDNYDWSIIDGRMIIRNSFSLYNRKDVWNMVRMHWSPKIDNMSFENTVVSEICPQYPELPLINE